jgi:hypothetical protein
MSVTWKSTLATAMAVGVFFVAAPTFGAMDQPLRVVYGDFDGDGLLDKVQGFPGASAGGGRVDVFWGNAAFNVAWPTVLSAVKDPATRLAYGRLGESLAVGDFNGDGLDDLAIGAPQANKESRSTFPLRSRARLAVDYIHSGSVVVIYGCGAAACGAVDSQGAGWPAVGSSLDPSTVRASGTPAQRILPASSVNYGRFGKSLAAGDFDNDDYADLAIGAPGDTVDGVLEAGSVTVIYGSANGLDLTTPPQVIHQNLRAGSAAEANDHFGTAIDAASLGGIFDRYSDLVVGVPDEDYDSEVDAGEVNVFFGGGAGLSTSGSTRFRHTTAMAGGSRSGDRLGHDLRAYDLLGTLHLGLQEAANCGSGQGYLAVLANVLGTPNPAAVLNCDADICDAASVPGDGALPAIPVNFIVLANSLTVGNGAALDLVPASGWLGNDPITGGQILGADYFQSMIDLLNQQLRADDGSPLCDGFDCLRLTYRSHTFYSSGMFSSGGVDVCPMLHAIADPEGSTPGEDERAIAENCDSTTCPRDNGGARYTDFSDFSEAAVDECTLLTDDDALNVFIYDAGERLAGDDGVVNTSDDVLSWVDGVSGRGRMNGHHPYFFVDYARALQPRTPARPFPWAAEEHEAGHAFGLGHACEPVDADPDDSLDHTHTMQGNGCTESNGRRNVGFATQGRWDVDGDWVIEVETMIATARAHVQEWQCP